MQENKNVIFCAYAYDDKSQSGLNVEKVKDKRALYFSNALVALVSAKRKNKDCDVALVTNTQVPEPYRSLFKQNEIKIFHEDFDCFTFDENYTWGLAFYKLCALKKMLAKEYHQYLLLDLDTCMVKQADDIWEEAKHNIVLYDINALLADPNYREFCAEVKEFSGVERPITHYGGEFIAGSRELLGSLLEQCEKVYQEMLEKHFQTKFGDEFILCLAADRLRMNIKNGGGYIFRFWTGSYWLVSTCYRHMTILHVPAEKRTGMLKIYRYFLKTKRLPKNKQTYRMLHLSRRSLRSYVGEMKSLLVSRLQEARKMKEV